MQFFQTALLMTSVAMGINAAAVPAAAPAPVAQAEVVAEVCGWSFIELTNGITSAAAADILCGNISCVGKTFNTRWNKLADGSFTVAEVCRWACIPGGCI
ncbi:unnamed protein product [Zymoseptoria tritici ST99CH_1A5]|uniref:LysM domain-containing protein n=3 Tax=Zymoseptoria tritici TaxID=1047171 RepID=A0A1X7RGH2_ZYMT9|nr:unnamed protein product [Zymoseptoria tritici ST99CH_3D7]SMR42869.1 unnamed protein product [Zymoseptoria tritici ST99CH_1E4]SMR45039.1 unnamed protein product [Zymoseptoria tritici ST99CH_3D1]SMY20204.1 unnamed protein product [Zymoseptoria tritici ST99CH_1A5]